ncbi:MAG: polysaccharide pyruvyl transferase family protein [Pseudomonadota bacterium]
MSPDRGAPGQGAARLVAIGTIAQTLAGGTVHLWGTGLDASINRQAPGEPWAPPPDTRFVVHALRGPRTAAALAAHGIAAPAVWGDPGYLAPRLWPDAAAEKTHDLGVVLHLSELATRGPAAVPRPEHRRYSIPADWAGRVRLITMDTAASLAGIAAKVAEIAACRRVLSTSLHGLVIADAYAIPAAWFALHGEGPVRLAIDDPDARIDHRFRDLYAGLGRAEVTVFGTPRPAATDWAAAMRCLDTLEPSGFDPAPLIDAFPGPLAPHAHAARWPSPAHALEETTL